MEEDVAPFYAVRGSRFVTWGHATNTCLMVLLKYFLPISREICMRIPLMRVIRPARRPHGWLGSRVEAASTLVRFKVEKHLHDKFLEHWKLG